jgi:hypothetical protein
LIIKVARAIIIHSLLPKNLWPLAVETAAYLLNRTPTRDLDWKTPFEKKFELLGQPGKKPYIGNIRVFGCRAYQLIHGINKLDKMRQRASIGYLVGYEGTNQYYIWDPATGKVTKTRDVTFNENLRFDPKDPHLAEIIQESIPPQATIIEGPDPVQATPTRRFGNEDSESESEEGNEDSQRVATSHFESTNQEPGNSLEEDASTALTSQPPQSTPNLQKESPAQEPYLTPGITPERDTIIEAPLAPNVSEEAGSVGGIQEPMPSARTRAPRDINADVTSEHIIEGRRQRRPRRDDHFVSYHAAEASDEEEVTYLAAYTAALTYKDPAVHRIHRDELPPEPKDWRDLKNHPYREGFAAAARTEFEALKTMDTFETIPIPKGVSIIPVTWVFKYKVDEDGYLTKFKARLCVRGDLQIMLKQDTYAGTLAIKSFRGLMAIAAVMDLNATQWDVVNAFLHSRMDEDVYVRLPEGFLIPGMCLKLLRALYGLRRSPRLWQQEFGSWLVSRGFTKVPDDPCVYRTNHIILIFYVDDIVALCRPEHQDTIDQFGKDLSEKYQVRHIGDLKWFLGIRVVRDRTNRRLWLCQDSYINKIVHKYHLEEGKRYSTPMSTDQRLATNDQEAKASKIREFQSKGGSLIYPSITTRPDVAYAAARIAQHLKNPSQDHIDAANRIIKYLDSTKTLAIEYSADNLQDSFIFATDAAFADNPDMRSTEGYIFKMFGGAVDWKASKQKTVTTSTTEAELLALSHGAREAYWWIRFFKAIRLDPEQDFEILCDNAQTVGLLTKEDPELKTRLRHVDIHHHWLRQEVQSKKIHIRWQSTDSMPADGLTKPLTNEKHQEFVRMLGLRHLPSE